MPETRRRVQMSFFRDFAPENDASPRRQPGPSLADAAGLRDRPSSMPLNDIALLDLERPGGAIVDDFLPGDRLRLTALPRRLVQRGVAALAAVEDHLVLGLVEVDALGPAPEVVRLHDRLVAGRHLLVRLAALL